MHIILLFPLLIIVYASDEVRKIETRGLYDHNKPRDANDFGPMREPPPRPGEGFPFAPGPYYNPPSDYLHQNHHHHHHEHYQGSDQTTPKSTFSNESSAIPLDFAKSINEYTVSDLLLNVIEDAPEQQTMIQSRFGIDETDTNTTERNAAQIARPAKCLPELTTVRIAQSKDPNVFYVPECTRIERCGGCCSHVLLACQPVETETVTFSIMKTEYSSGTRKLKYVGKEPVLVERHTKCKCGCKIKESDCTIYQEYRESECRCVCKNIDEEKKCYKNSYKKLWNPELCSCQCREELPCSTGFKFDHNECRCVQNQFQRRYVLTESVKEQPYD